jgi:uncharacterized protein with HEPN domain
MDENDITRLQHMLDAAQEAINFVKGYKRMDLDQNRGLVLILAKEIEIIGEAASKVSQEARERMPDIEWRDVIGMRNKLVHAYFEINLDILWGTVQYNLPKLIKELERVPELQ